MVGDAVELVRVLVLVAAVMSGFGGSGVGAKVNECVVVCFEDEMGSVGSDAGTLDVLVVTVSTWTP